MDLPREELEAELWQLRSVEIDLQNALSDNRALRSLHSEQAGLTGELEQARHSMEQRYEDEHQRRLRVEREKEAVMKENERLHRERTWAMEELQIREEADRMYRNYDFKIADKLPEQPRKRNHRLTR